MAASKNTEADVVEVATADTSIPHQVAKEKAIETPKDNENVEAEHKLNFKDRLKNVAGNKKVIASAITAAVLAVGVIVVQKRRGVTETEEVSS